MPSVLRHTLLIFVVLFFNLEAKSQDTTVARNNLYIEVFGGAGLYSINYERLFFNKKTAFAIRGGASYFPVVAYGKDISNIFSLPVSFSFLIGKGPHFLETGIGSSFLYGSNFDQSGGLFNSLIIGYRLQWKQKGTLIRAGYIPIYENSLQNDYTRFFHYGGFSMGLTF